MTAGSWIYIGSQGIVQGTYETFAEMGRQHFGGNLAGRWILTAGLGGMGGAQPLAATMAGASMLAIECRPERIAKRLETRYLDVSTKTTRRGARADRTVARDRQPLSVGLLGNAAKSCRSCCGVGVRPDAVTDQTSAHDPVNGYLPAGWTRRAVGSAARGGSRARWRRPRASRWQGTSRRCSQFQTQGIPVVRLRQQHPPGRASTRA